MKPSNFAPVTPVPRGHSTPTTAPTQDTRPQGVPAIIRSLMSDPTAGQQYVHAAGDVLIPQPHTQRVHQLEDYVASFRSSVQKARPLEQPVTLAEPPQTQTAVESTLSAEQTRSIEELLQQLNRVDAAHVTTSAEAENPSRVPVAPHIPAANFPELDEMAAETRETHEQQPTVETAETLPGNDFNRDELVRAIATAVASVLTDVPSEQLQQKLKQPFDIAAELGHPAEAIQKPEQIAAAAKLAESTMAAEPVVSETQADATTPTNEPTEPSSFEIPAAAAAWDVDAFRWPLLSNQLIASAADSIQQLYDHIQSTTTDLSDNPTSPKRIAITANGRGEGCTSIAISLARWAAASGNRVLMIDADLASPSLTTAIGLEQGLSWVDGIRRNDKPAEVIVRSKDTNICVMPMAPVKSRSEMPTTVFNQLGSFVGSVERHFDWIIIDAGPGSQLTAELSRPDLLLDVAVLVGSEPQMNGFGDVQARLQAMGLNRFVIAQNSVQRQEAA